jgi:hypothetical protein
MILSKYLCTCVFIFLYGGVILSLFFRAYVRQKLLKDYSEIKKGFLTDVVSNHRLLKPVLAIPRQMHALRDLGKTIVDTPEPVKRRYKYFLIINWVAIVLLALLVVFSFVAHKLCGS